MNCDCGHDGHTQECVEDYADRAIVQIRDQRDAALAELEESRTIVQELTARRNTMIDTNEIREYPGCPACSDTILELCDALDAARIRIVLDYQTLAAMKEDPR